MYISIFKMPIWGTFGPWPWPKDAQTGLNCMCLGIRWHKLWWQERLQFVHNYIYIHIDIVVFICIYVYVNISFIVDLYDYACDVRHHLWLCAIIISDAVWFILIFYGVPSKHWYNTGMKNLYLRLSKNSIHVAGIF